MQNQIQKIYFGAPGTGKSHKIKEDLKAKQIPKNQIEQITFHPEYDYASFVGGYKPAMDDNDKITYKFVSQVFTDIYTDLDWAPNKDFLLPELRRLYVPNHTFHRFVHKESGFSVMNRLFDQILEADSTPVEAS